MVKCICWAGQFRLAEHNTNSGNRIMPMPSSTCVEIVKRTNSNLHRTSTRSCRFVNCGNGVGIKFYDNKKLRDSCYKWQKEFCRAGAGPKVYGKTSMIVIDKRRYWGYLTEIVTVMSQKKLQNIANYHYEKWRKIDDWFEIKVDEFLENLESEFDSDILNTVRSDGHKFNFGWKNGVMMLIDYDNFYYSDQ